MNLYAHVLPSMQYNAMQNMNEFLTDKKQQKRRPRATKQKVLMNNDEKQAKLKRIETLVGGAEHMRTSALHLAGLYLRGAEGEIVEQELSKLDEEILEDEDLFTTYETLFRFI